MCKDKKWWRGFYKLYTDQGTVCLIIPCALGSRVKKLVFFILCACSLWPKGPPNGSIIPIVQLVVEIWVLQI